MATRHFETPEPRNSQASAFAEAFWMSGNFAPLRLARIETHRAAQRRIAQSAAATLDASNMGRCLRWAFALEGGLALLVYAAWSLLHLWR